MTEETKQFTITRDGKKDLVFTGVHLAGASDHEHQGPQNSRWSEIDIYRTDSSKYIVAQTYRTCWQGESDSRRADVCESAQAVYDLLSWEEDGGEEWEDGRKVEHDTGISDMAKEALEKAAETDSAFEGLTTEEV